MRAVDIEIKKPGTGNTLFKTRFKKNRKFYMQEALGLAIFMVSACFFSGLLFGKNGFLVPDFSAPIRQVILGGMMGLTALYIFYSPFTSLSGSHINPAVTLAFFRVGKIGRWDGLFDGGPDGRKPDGCTAARCGNHSRRLRTNGCRSH